MSYISSQNAELPQTDNNTQVGTVQPVEKVDAMHSNQFSSLLNKEGQEQEKALADNSSEDGGITPEELQRQIRESIFKNGFNKAMEKAKEISKELKES